MPSYGLIVEGTFDAAIYAALVRRLHPEANEVLVRDMGGVSQVKRLFPAMLRDLEEAREGESVDKALVLRDADGQDVGSLERAMQARIRGQEFRFPRGLEFNIAVQMVDAWLLADLRAISTIALRRRGAELDAASELPDEPEKLPNPKRMLSRLLCQAAIPHTPQVCGEIASVVDLAALRMRCPSFRLFEEKLLR